MKVFGIVYYDVGENMTLWSQIELLIMMLRSLSTYLMCEIIEYIRELLKGLFNEWLYKNV